MKLTIRPGGTWREGRPSPYEQGVFSLVSEVLKQRRDGTPDYDPVPSAMGMWTTSRGSDSMILTAPEHLDAFRWKLQTGKALGAVVVLGSTGAWVAERGVFPKLTGDPRKDSRAAVALKPPTGVRFVHGHADDLPWAYVVVVEKHQRDGAPRLWGAPLHVSPDGPITAEPFRLFEGDFELDGLSGRPLSTPTVGSA